MRYIKETFVYQTARSSGGFTLHSSCNKGCREGNFNSVFGIVASETKTLEEDNDDNDVDNRG